MSGKKKVFWALFSMVLAALSIWAVLGQSKSLSLGQLWISVGNANELWMFLALCCTMLYGVAEGEALRCILEGIGYRVPFRHGLLYSTADLYFSGITPSSTGGQPASAYFMVKDGIPAGAATATLLANLILYFVALMAVGLLAVITEFRLFLGLRLVSKILIGLGYLVLAGLTLLYFFMLGRGERVFTLLRRVVCFLHRIKLIHRLELRLERLQVMEADFDSCAKTMKGKGRVMFHALLWNLLQRAALIAVPVFLFLALGGRGTLAWHLFTAQCLVTLGYNCVPVPGAMGVADYLMLDAFSGLMALEEAFRLEVLSRGLTFYLCVLACGVLTGLGHLLRKKKKTGETPPQEAPRSEEESPMLPQDPCILFSYVNQKLRDDYDSLDALCEDLEQDRAALEEKLAKAGFTYDPAHKCFR